MPEPRSGAVALHRRHGMVDKTLHEHAPALSEPSQPTRSRSCLSKCAKDSGHFRPISRSAVTVRSCSPNWTNASPPLGPAADYRLRGAAVGEPIRDLKPEKVGDL